MQAAAFGAPHCPANLHRPLLCAQGINRMGYVAVPLYDTLGDEAVAYIVEHAEVRARPRRMHLGCQGKEGREEGRKERQKDTTILKGGYKMRPCPLVHPPPRPPQ